MIDTIDFSESVGGREWWLCCYADLRAGYLRFDSLDGIIWWQKSNIPKGSRILLAKTVDFDLFGPIYIVRKECSWQSAALPLWRNINHD